MKNILFLFNIVTFFACTQMVHSASDPEQVFFKEEKSFLIPRKKAHYLSRFRAYPAEADAAKNTPLAVRRMTVGKYSILVCLGPQTKSGYHASYRLDERNCFVPLTMEYLAELAGVRILRR